MRGINRRGDRKKAMRKFFAITLAINLLFGGQAFSQIDYYEASGEGPTLEQARQQALKNLTNSIQTFIQTRFESRISENKGTVSEDFAQAQTTTYSGIVLRNVTYIENHTPKGWLVTARVLKSDVEKAFEKRKYAIRSLLNLATAAEQRADLATALRNYFWAYVLTFSYPDTIQIAIAQTAGNAATLIPARLNAIFKEVHATVEKSFIDGDDFVAITQISFSNRSVTNLLLSYYDGVDQNWCEVENGKTTFVLRGNFSEPKIVLRPQIEYRYVSEMEQNPEVYQIYQFLQLPAFDNSFPLTLDLQNYVKVDFTAIFKGNVVYFQPQLSHLSVTQYLWDFGDGRTSTLAQPALIFAQERTYQVSLKINGNPSLTCRKILDIKNQSLTGTNFSIPKPHKPTAPQLLADLRVVGNLQDFTSKAQELSRQGRIVFGSAKNFENKEGLYCFIFSSNSAELRAILTVQNGEFINIVTNRPEALGTYKGDRAIWVEVLR